MSSTAGDGCQVISMTALQQKGAWPAGDKTTDKDDTTNTHAQQTSCFDNIRENGLLLAAYFVYFGFAVKNHQGDENSWRLIGFTIFGVSLLSWRLMKKTAFGPTWDKFWISVSEQFSKGKRRKIVRWFFYVAMTGFMVMYVVLFIAKQSPDNLRSLTGIFGFPFLLFLYSNNRRKVNWHTVYWGMALQFLMGILCLKTTWGASIIRWCGNRVESYIANGKAGSIFLFGEKYTDHPFAFGAGVQIFCLIVGISVLTYLGVSRFIVETLGRAFASLMQVTPAEGIDVVANIFLSAVESAMLIQEYIEEMTPSQLFITYAGGLTTVGGVAIVIFISFGVPAAPVVAASALSAPAALAASKLVFPSHKDEVVPKPETGASAQVSFLKKPKSLAEAVIVGIQQSTTLVVQVMTFILTFIIILEFLNNTLEWFGDRLGYDGITFEFLFSYVFYPFAFIMGARAEDCLFIGKLLGIRTFSFAVVAYPKLGPIIQNGIAFREYVSESVNNTWTAVGEDILLDNWNRTLTGGVIDARSEVIATFSLCGSASFALIGMMIGVYTVIVPTRREEITQHMGRAFVVGTIASYLTACFAGLLFEEGLVYD